jgi:hypothetical protein
MLIWRLSIFTLLLAGSVEAADMPFVFDNKSLHVADFTPAQFEEINTQLSSLAGVPVALTPSDNETLEFPITGGGKTAFGTIEKKAVDLKNILNSKVEADEPVVIEEAGLAAGRYSGDYTIEQISGIYDHLKDNWHYMRDPRGIDYFKNASESLILGRKSGCVGVGDCDDFAILMSALIEAAGGTTRIIMARNNTTGGHAYAEVYLGQLNATDSQVEAIINWLKQNYDSDKIYTHVDTEAKDVWLNLDWGADENNNAHPGGPFYPGESHYVLCIRDKFGKTPINPPEKTNKPPRLIGLTSDRSSPQEAGTQVIWTAEAKDFDNDQISYRFFINDESMTNWSRDNEWTMVITENDTGTNQVEVRIRDGKHKGPNRFDDRKVVIFNVTAPNPEPTTEINTPEINIPKISLPELNNPPVIESLLPDKTSPQEAGTSVTWSARASDDEDDPVQFKFLLNDRPATDWTLEDQWTWTTSEASIGVNRVSVQVRDDKVRDDRDDLGGGRSKSIEFTVVSSNQPPSIQSFSADRSSPQKAGAAITWTAQAIDPDGDDIVYRFWLNGQPVTEWLSWNQWTWTATEADAKENQIDVRIRDQKHMGSGGFDDRKTASFVIESANIYQKPNDLSGTEFSGYNSIWKSIYQNDEKWAAKGRGKVGRPA